jgi:hypothetical protein
MCVLWFILAFVAGAVVGIVALVAYCTHAMHGSDDIA